MQALVLDLVLDGQEPDPSATLGEILTDDQTPLGSLERITYLRLRDNPLVVRRLFQENVSREQLEILVTAEIVKPRVVQTWTLDIALLNRDQIDEDLAETNRLRAEEAEENNTVWNDAELEFRSWIDVDFFTRSLNFDAELTGMRNAILGTIYMILITIAFAFPIGIGAAIYLEEYAGDSLISRVIQTNIDNLAGVPSIIYGLLGVTLFVRTLEPLTSGSLFGFTDPTTANGRTILSASLTMALLILPIIIINAQEAIQAVQPSIRQASYGLGATKWQTVRSHVLPSAMPGILTGTILAMSRAIGETAPLIVVGAATFIVADPSGPFSKFTALPMQIYFWTTQPRDADKAVAAAAIVILLAVLLTLNSTAIVLRNRFERRLRGK
ncbi:MAG: phosphate ABC transporter permease PstA [Chloroflexi bacterium]|nr:phosphate ABC transporter permease PstA [Chloroflexota bacterium]